MSKNRGAVHSLRLAPFPFVARFAPNLALSAVSATPRCRGSQDDVQRNRRFGSPRRPSTALDAPSRALARRNPRWRSVATPGCAVRSSRDCQTGAFAARKASKPCVRGEEGGWATASGDGSGALGTRRRRTSVRVIPPLPAPPPCRSDPFRRILGPQCSLSAFGRNGREVQNHRPALSSW